MWLMPASLQLATICWILVRESKAVLAVVVTQIPRMALGSQEGTEGVGVTGVLGVEGVVELPPPLEHAVKCKDKQKTTMPMENRWYNFTVLYLPRT